MSKHTKGPWVAVYDDKEGRYSDGLVTSSEGFDIAIITGYNYGCYFGGFDRKWNEGHEVQDHIEHRANANLIASAPELLEALECCLEFIELPDDCAEKAIAAIKKAKGE